MIIAVLNKSTLVTNAEASTMSRLVASQVRYHYVPAWQHASAAVLFYVDEAQVPPGAAKIAIFDDSDTPGAAGWHSENAGNPFGRVFVRPVLDVGGNALRVDPTVCSILSHEVLELLADPTVNLWASDFGLNGSPRLYAVEICDPVEADSYTVTVGGTQPASGRVSNFVLPSWFDPTGASKPYDHLNKLSTPFSMSPHGYLIYEDGTGSHTIYGRRYPEWRKATKVGAARSARRSNKVGE